MERAVVVLQEERFKVSQRVLFAKQSPNVVIEVRIATVKLYGLHFGKLFYQDFINDKVLFTIFSRLLVLMLADALF